MRTTLKYYGPGIVCLSKSCNKQELYSFDPVEQIPKLFFFSYIDSKRNLWTFDIRSLGQLLSMGELKQNPYTREPFQKRFMDGVIDDVQIWAVALDAGQVRALHGQP